MLSPSRCAAVRRRRRGATAVAPPAAASALPAAAVEAAEVAPARLPPRAAAAGGIAAVDPKVFEVVARRSQGRRPHARSEQRRGACTLAAAARTAAAGAGQLWRARVQRRSAAAARGCAAPYGGALRGGYAPTVAESASQVQRRKRHRLAERTPYVPASRPHTHRSTYARSGDATRCARRGRRARALRRRRLGGCWRVKRSCLPHHGQRLGRAQPRAPQRHERHHRAVRAQGRHGASRPRHSVAQCRMPHAARGAPARRPCAATAPQHARGVLCRRRSRGRRGCPQPLTPPLWGGATPPPQVVMIGDGQVTMGSEVVKPNVKKVRRIGTGVIGGFAGTQLCLQCTTLARAHAACAAQARRPMLSRCSSGWRTSWKSTRHAPMRRLMRRRRFADLFAAGRASPRLACRGS